MSIEELYQNAELYEAENSVMMHDVDFWKSTVIKTKSRKILEIGCGTGRIARHIIESVDSYTGIDISDDFIQYFKGSECYKKNKAKISIYKTDVLNYKSDDRYDLIMLTSQFPGHIYDYRDFCAILSNLAIMLNDDGKIIIDYCNPDVRFLENHKEYQFCYEFPFDGIVKVYEKNKYNQIEQINYEYRKYMLNDGSEILQTIPFRIYFPQEMDSLITTSGLHIDEKYGNYDGSEFEEYCIKQIYFLSKE